jgi:PTS system glucitol/sorbitol-specific IIA component
MIILGGMNSMDIKYDVAITSIGNLAKTFLTNNSSAILLDEGIRPNLSDMVLEHTPGKLEEDIKKGDKLLMGGIKYTIEKVGDAVNENLREEGHCTLVFNAEGSMPGQIILKGPALPVLTVGAHITFTKK